MDARESRELENGGRGGGKCVDDDEDRKGETSEMVEEEGDLSEEKLFFHGIGDDEGDGFGGARRRPCVFITFFILHLITYKYEGLLIMR